MLVKMKTERKIFSFGIEMFKKMNRKKNLSSFIKTKKIRMMTQHT